MLLDEKLKKIKLIALDLDGTLLNDQGIIGNETKKRIKELQDAGVRFTFATGRLHSTITEYAAELNITSPLISLDGCIIKSYPENHVIFESAIKKKYIEKSLLLAEKYLINIALCHADAIYYTEHNAVISQLLEKFGAHYQEVDSYDNYIKNTLEVVFAGDSRESMKYLRSRLTFPYSFGLAHSYYKSQKHGGIYYLEVRRGGISKGKGLLRLLKHFKLKVNESAVMGDWYNDISLFNTGAFKVALNNAVPEIKRMADMITQKTNNEEGITEFFEMVLRAKRK